MDKETADKANEALAALRQASLLTGEVISTITHVAGRLRQSMVEEGFDEATANATAVAYLQGQLTVLAGGISPKKK